MFPARRMVIPVAGAGLVAVLATTALSATAPPAPKLYDRYTMSSGEVAVAGAPGLKAYPRASILVPRAWQRVSRTRSTITFRNDKPACRLTIRFRVRVVAGPAVTAAEHVTAAEPAAGPRYVQDEGVRGSTAWRVVRQPAPVKGHDAIQAYATSAVFGGRLPAGQRAWMELLATSRAPASAECHAGHFRAPARQIGDAIAVSLR